MINSKLIKDLHPKVADLCNKFIEACGKEGIKVIITSTYRDNESQNALYAQGRTKPGNIVTKAKGGQSIHNYRLAFDFAPVVNNKIDWNNIVLFKRCGAIAESLGLEYAGNWKSFKEYAHCQFTDGLTKEDLQAGNIVGRCYEDI